MEALNLSLIFLSRQIHKTELFHDPFYEQEKEKYTSTKFSQELPYCKYSGAKPPSKMMLAIILMSFPLTMLGLSLGSEFEGIEKVISQLLIHVWLLVGGYILQFNIHWKSEKSRKSAFRFLLFYTAIVVYLILSSTFLYLRDGG